MSQIQIPIYFLKKTGQIAYKYITLEELYRLYHKKKYKKNEEFVQKFITENDIDYIEEDGKRKNLYYTSLEELKKKCEEKGKPIKNHLQKQDVKDYEVEEITIGESTKNPSFFYGVDMYGNIIKFTMSSKTEKQLSEDDKHEIVRQYKLVYNPTGKKDESGRIGFRVSTFGRDAKLDDIIEDVTDMVSHKGNAIQDVPGQLKVIDFPQNDLEENSDKKKIFDLAKENYCLQIMQECMGHINNPTTEDLNKLEKFKRAYYMLYNKELQQEDLEKTDKLKKLILYLFNRAYYILYGKELQQEDLKKTDELNKLVQNSEQQIAENNEKLSENNVKYNYYTNTLELINNSNSSLDLDYINYKLEQFNTHFIESRHYIGMYVPQNNQSNTLQNSATPYIPQPKPSKSNSSSEAMREFPIKNKNSTSTSSYDDKSTLCYNIETEEFSIKTYKEIEQNKSLKKVMFPDGEKILDKTTFKPKIINTLDEARKALHNTDMIYIDSIGQCVCGFKNTNKYEIKIKDKYKLLGVDIELFNDKIECTKKTYCYYLRDDNQLCYGALSDEEMKQKYVLNIKIRGEVVPLNTGIQDKLPNSMNLKFLKPETKGKKCTVRTVLFDNAIHKLIFNIDGTDYYFMNDDYVGVAMKFIPPAETKSKSQPLVIKPKPLESSEPKPRTRKTLTSTELVYADEKTAEKIFLKNYYLEKICNVKNFFNLRGDYVVPQETLLLIYNQAAKYLNLDKCEEFQNLEQCLSDIDYYALKGQYKKEFSHYDIYFDDYNLRSKKDGNEVYINEISGWINNSEIKQYNLNSLKDLANLYKRLFICLCLEDYYANKGKASFNEYCNKLKSSREEFSFLNNSFNFKNSLMQEFANIERKFNDFTGCKPSVQEIRRDSNERKKFIESMSEQMKNQTHFSNLYTMYNDTYNKDETVQLDTTKGLQPESQPQPQPESPSLSNADTTSASSPSEELSKPLTSPSESEEESASESEEDLESESQPQPQPELKPKPEPEPETKPSNPESTLGYIEDKERLPEYVLCYNLKAKKFNICSKESINKNKDNYLICYKNNDKNEVCGADSKKEVYNSVINTRIKLKDASERFIEYDCQELEGYIDTRNMVIRHMYNQKSEYNETLMTLDDEEVNTSKHICYFLSKGKEITKHYQPTLEGTLGYQNTNSNDNYIWMFYKEDETNHIELFDFDQYDQKQKHNPKIFSISTDAEGRKTINFFKCEDGKLEKEKEEQLKEYPTLENPGILEQEQPATADYIEKPEPELKPDSSSLSNADTTSTSSPSKEPSTPSAESEEDLDSESEPLTAEPKPQPEPVSESSKPKPELKPSKPESESTLLPMATSMAGSLSNPDEPMSVFPVSIETPSSSGTSDLFPALSKPIIERAVSKLDEDPKKPLSALSEDSDMYSYDSSTTTQTMLDLSPDMVKILALYNYKKSLNNKLKILMITRGIFGLDEASKEEDQIIFNYYTKVCKKADELLNKQLEEKSINLGYVEKIEKQVSNNQALRQQVAQTSKELGYTQALLKFDEQAQKYIQPILDYVILDIMKQDIEEKKVVKENWPILPGCLDDVINFSDLDAKKQQEAIVAKQEELKKRIKIDINSEGIKIFAKQYFFGADGVEKSDEDLKQRYLAQDFYRHLDDFYYHTQEIQYPNDYIAQLFTERTDKRRYPEVKYDITVQALFAFIQGRLYRHYTTQQLLKITKYSKFDIVKRDLFTNMFITTDDKYKDNATDEDTSADHLLRRYVLSNSGGSNSISSLLLLSSTHQVLCLQSKDFESMYAQIDEKEEEKKELEKKEKYLKGIEEKIKSNKDELKKIQNKLNSKTALTAKEKEDKVKLKTGINNLEETLESETKLLQTKKEKLKKEEEKSKQEKAKLKEEYEQYYLKVQKELLLQYREDMKFSEELQGLETADEIRKCLQSKYVELEKEQSKFANTLREYLLNDPVAKAGWLKTYSQRSFGFEVKKCYGEIKIVEGVNVEDCRDLIEQWNTAINNMKSEKNTKQTIETTLSESYALYRHIVNGDLYFPKEIEYKKFLEDRKEDSLLLYNLGTEEIVMNYINLVNSQDKEEQTVNFSSCIPSDFATKQAFTVIDHDITTVFWRSVVGSKQKESCYQTYLSMYIQYLQDNGLSLLDINLASLTDAVRFAVTNSFVKSQIIKNREELEKSHDKPKEGTVKTEENKDEPKKEDDKEKDSIDLFDNFMKNFKESLGIKAALYRNIFTVDELIEIYKPNAGDDSKELRQQIQLLGEQEYDKFDDINKSRLLSLYYYILQYAPESKLLMNTLKADHPILYLSLPLGCEFRSTNDAGNKAAAFIRGMSRKEPDELAYSLLQRSKQILSNYWNETASGGMDIITDENNVGIIAAKLIENYHLPKSFLINPYVSSTLLKAEDEFYEEKEMTNTEQIDKNSKMIDRVLDKICCNFKNQSNYYYDIFCWSVYMLTDNLEETQKQQILDVICKYDKTITIKDKDTLEEKMCVMKTIKEYFDKQYENDEERIEAYKRFFFALSIVCAGTYADRLDMHEDKNFERFFKYWKEHANFQDRCNQLYDIYMQQFTIASSPTLLTTSNYALVTILSEQKGKEKLSYIMESFMKNLFSDFKEFYEDNSSDWQKTQQALFEDLINNREVEIVEADKQIIIPKLSRINKQEQTVSYEEIMKNDREDLFKALQLQMFIQILNNGLKPENTREGIEIVYTGSSHNPEGVFNSIKQQIVEKFPDLKLGGEHTEDIQGKITEVIKILDAEQKKYLKENEQILSYQKINDEICVSTVNENTSEIKQTVIKDKNFVQEYSELQKTLNKIIEVQDMSMSIPDKSSDLLQILDLSRSTSGALPPLDHDLLLDLQARIQTRPAPLVRPPKSMHISRNATPDVVNADMLNGTVTDTMGTAGISADISTSHTTLHASSTTPTPSTDGGLSTVLSSPKPIIATPQSPMEVKFKIADNPRETERKALEAEYAALTKINPVEPEGDGIILSVGDVHGSVKAMLQPLLHNGIIELKYEDGKYTFKKGKYIDRFKRIIFLGDYVDRGNFSFENMLNVKRLDTLINGGSLDGTNDKLKFICGNHDVNSNSICKMAKNGEYILDNSENTIMQSNLFNGNKPMKTIRDNFHKCLTLAHTEILSGKKKAYFTHAACTQAIKHAIDREKGVYNKDKEPIYLTRKGVKGEWVKYDEQSLCLSLLTRREGEDGVIERSAGNEIFIHGHTTIDFLLDEKPECFTGIAGNRKQIKDKKPIFLDSASSELYSQSYYNGEKNCAHPLSLLIDDRGNYTFQHATISSEADGRELVGEVRMNEDGDIESSSFKLTTNAESKKKLEKFQYYQQLQGQCNEHTLAYMGVFTDSYNSRSTENLKSEEQINYYKQAKQQIENLTTLYTSDEREDLVSLSTTLSATDRLETDSSSHNESRTNTDDEYDYNDSGSTSPRSPLPKTSSLHNTEVETNDILSPEGQLISESTSSDSEDEEELPEHVLVYTKTDCAFKIISKKRVKVSKTYLKCYKEDAGGSLSICGGDGEEAIFDILKNTNNIKIQEEPEKYIDGYCEYHEDKNEVIIQSPDHLKATSIKNDDDDAYSIQTEKPLYVYNQNNKIECLVDENQVRRGYSGNNIDNYFIWMYYEEKGQKHIELFNPYKYTQKQTYSPKIFSISSNNEGSDTIKFFKYEDGKLEKEKEQQFEGRPTIESLGILAQEQPATVDSSREAVVVTADSPEKQQETSIAKEKPEIKVSNTTINLTPSEEEIKKLESLPTYNVAVANYIYIGGKKKEVITLTKLSEQKGRIAAENGNFAVKVTINRDKGSEDYGKVIGIEFGMNKKTGQPYTTEEARQLLLVSCARKNQGLAKTDKESFLDLVLKNPTYYTNEDCSVRLPQFKNKTTQKDIENTIKSCTEKSLKDASDIMIPIAIKTPEKVNHMCVVVATKKDNKVNFKIFDPSKALKLEDRERVKQIFGDYIYDNLDKENYILSPNKAIQDELTNKSQLFKGTCTGISTEYINYMIDTKQKAKKLTEQQGEVIQERYATDVTKNGLHHIISGEQQIEQQAVKQETKPQDKPSVEKKKNSVFKENKTVIKDNLIQNTRTNPTLPRPPKKKTDPESKPVIESKSQEVPSITTQSSTMIIRREKSQSKTTETKKLVKPNIMSKVNKVNTKPEKISSVIDTRPEDMTEKEVKTAQREFEIKEQAKNALQEKTGTTKTQSPQNTPSTDSQSLNQSKDSSEIQLSQPSVLPKPSIKQQPLNKTPLFKPNMRTEIKKLNSKPEEISPFIDTRPEDMTEKEVKTAQREFEINKQAQNALQEKTNTAENKPLQETKQVKQDKVVDKKEVKPEAIPVKNTDIDKKPIKEEITVRNAPVEKSKQYFIKTEFANGKLNMSLIEYKTEEHNKDFAKFYNDNHILFTKGANGYGCLFEEDMANKIINDSTTTNTYNNIFIYTDNKYVSKNEYIQKKKEEEQKRQKEEEQKKKEEEQKKKEEEQKKKGTSSMEILKNIDKDNQVKETSKESSGLWSNFIKCFSKKSTDNKKQTLLNTPEEQKPSKSSWWSGKKKKTTEKCK